MAKTMRHYYWLVAAFIRKNLRFLIISFIASFFTIILFINVLPVLHSILFKEQQILGLSGDYTYQNLPRQVSELISNPLVAVSQNGELVPVLVNSWEVIDKGHTYRFHLKTDLLWSDGDAVAAKDIPFNFRDVKVNIRDRYTLDLTLEQPLVIFPNYLNIPVVSKHFKGIGGLYRVSSFKMDRDRVKQLSLVPNKADLPYKVYRFYKNEDDMITAYKKGEITSFQTSKQNVASLFSDWKNTKVSKTTNFDTTMVLFFNTEQKTLGNIDVRRGITTSLPNFEEFGQPASGPIPPTSFAYNDELEITKQNLEKAKSLLKKNIKSTEEGKLTLYTFFDHASVAEEIKQTLEGLGLKIDLKLLSFRPTDFDMFLTVWNAPRDPDQYFFWHSTQQQSNLTHLKSPRVDKLLEDGRQIINVKQRVSIYHDFQRVLVEELPAAFLYHPYVFTIERR